MTASDHLLVGALALALSAPFALLVFATNVYVFGVTGVILVGVLCVFAHRGEIAECST